MVRPTKNHTQSQLPLSRAVPHVAQAFLPVLNLDVSQPIAATKKRAGSALLMVLWLSAALSAIAFTVANTVRSETERTSTAVDSIRAYYLATGAIDRALLYINWGSGTRKPDGTARYFENPMPVLRFDFPSGSAAVEIIPETAKLSVNQALPRELANLMVALGVPPERATQITQGILDWRTVSPGGAFTQFDQHYMGLTPSFRARHASFQEIEELLLVQGVTPDLFYGSYAPDQAGKLLPHAGLRDCLSVYGSIAQLDVNTVHPAVMQAVGIPPASAAAIVNMRQSAPIRSMERLGALSAPRLGIVPSTVATLRATSRLRLAGGQYSDLRRTVSAMVKFLGPEWNPPFHIMRWYDTSVSLPATGPASVQ
jgi:general secretion pathway protein K